MNQTGEDVRQDTPLRPQICITLPEILFSIYLHGGMFRGIGEIDKPEVSKPN